MAKIICANYISWEDMWATGRTIICTHDCRVGDIIDGCFVCTGSSPISTRCKAGDWTYVVPLRWIRVVETHCDLSKYGFRKINNSKRWIRE